MQTISTQIYRAYVTETGETLAVGNFGKAYEAINGSYAETRDLTQAQREERAKGKAYEKLFDLAEDYSNSSNFEEYFESAVRTLNDNDGLDDRDESDRIAEAVDNAISVYTFNIMECATQDISLATETNNLTPKNTTTLQVLQTVIYEKLTEAVNAYQEVTKNL